MSIIEYFTLLWEWLQEEYMDGRINEYIIHMREVINNSRNRINQWWTFGLFITLWFFVGSVALFFLSAILGLIYETGVFNSIVGIIVALPLFVIFAWWTPLSAIIGILSELIHGNIKCAPDRAFQYGEKWLGFVASLLMWELIVAFALSYIPYWNQPARIPGIILCALIIAITGIKWMRRPLYRTVITGLVILIFIGNIWACFFPRSAQAIQTRLNRWDGQSENVLVNGLPEKQTSQPPPRDTQWMPRMVSQEPQNLMRLFNGDKIKYTSPEGFWLTFKNGRKFYCNASVYPGEIRYCTCSDMSLSGDMVGIYGEKSNFQMSFIVESEIAR